MLLFDVPHHDAAAVDDDDGEHRTGLLFATNVRGYIEAVRSETVVSLPWSIQTLDFSL